MVASIITAEDLEAFADQLLQKITKLLAEDQNTPQGKWLKSHEIRRLLKISPGTLQTLRISGKLPYTKIGGIMFYHSDDVQKLLDDHRKNSGRRPPNPPADPIPQRVGPVVPPKRPRVAQKA